MSSSSTPIPILVLAFDLELAGATPEFTVIAIACSVLNEKFEELDSLFLPGYIPPITPFEPRCWNEFWKNNLDQLKLLAYNGDLLRYGANAIPYRQEEMIKAFHNFRLKWEAKAKEMGAKLELVSDNNVFDGGRINIMMNRYMPKVLPIPYSATEPQTYQPFFETFSQQRGVLMAVDPTWNEDWEMTKRIFELFDAPPCPRPHDHHPSNDAYSIAYDQIVLHGIRKGVYKLKPKLPDTETKHNTTLNIDDDNKKHEN